MTAERPLALWATPRTASTAFERMVMERGDLTVLTEPFSLAYYHGAQRVSDRYAADGREGPTYAEVLDAVAGAARPVFIKDMPHHLGPLRAAAEPASWSAAFLIRDPAWTVPSVARMWPDFTDDELGYEAQHQMFEQCRAAAADVPLVIHSDDLRNHPEPVVTAWCSAMGLDSRPEALGWEPGMPAQWRVWEEWFAGTARTSGFVPAAAGPPPDVGPELSGRIARARPHYEALKEHALAV